MGCSPSSSSGPKHILVEEKKPLSKGIEEEAIIAHATGSVRADSLFIKRSASQKSDNNKENHCYKETAPLDLKRFSDSQHSSTSGNSSFSADSGIYELDDEYSYVITENSSPDRIRKVEESFVPNDDLDLTLVGKACPRKLSSKEKERKEQQAILDLLKQQSLVVKPPSRAAGGIRFELVSSLSPKYGSPVRKLPPLTEQKKHRRRKKKLTTEEIQEKLRKAEERRKMLNEEKLSKIVSKDRQEVMTFHEEKTIEKKEKIEQKIQVTAQNREHHLHEIQERLRAREEHAKKVREKKQMLASGFNYILPIRPHHEPQKDMK